MRFVPLSSQAVHRDISVRMSQTAGMAPHVEKTAQYLAEVVRCPFLIIDWVTSSVEYIRLMISPLEAERNRYAASLTSSGALRMTSRSAEVPSTCRFLIDESSLRGQSAMPTCELNSISTLFLAKRSRSCVSSTSSDLSLWPF